MQALHRIISTTEGMEDPELRMGTSWIISSTALEAKKQLDRKELRSALRFAAPIEVNYIHHKILTASQMINEWGFKSGADHSRQSAYNAIAETAKLVTVVDGTNPPTTSTE